MALSTQPGVAVLAKRSAAERASTVVRAMAATVIAVPSAMANVPRTPAQNSPFAKANIRSSKAPEHGLSPIVPMTAAASAKERTGFSGNGA